MLSIELWCRSVISLPPLSSSASSSSSLDSYHLILSPFLPLSVSVSVDLSSSSSCFPSPIKKIKLVWTDARVISVVPMIPVSITNVTHLGNVFQTTVRSATLANAMKAMWAMGSNAKSLSQEIIVMVRSLACLPVSVSATTLSR
jgi:hypothetical protein